MTGTDPVPLKLLRLPHGAGLALPDYASGQAAGLDLRAAIPAGESVTLRSGERVLVPTGIALQIPPGFEAQVRPRSGLAVKHGVTVLNSPGTIDADYRGEINVILVNLGPDSFELRRGDRIAQLVLAPVSRAVLIEVSSLDRTPRGTGGFGSTGLGG